jgi:Fe-S oxidoreductase
VAGFDIYDQAQSEAAWDHLNEVIRNLSARKIEEPLKYAFSGEHGIAGKAPVFYRDQIGEEEYRRVLEIKELIDPKNIFNRNTIFLKGPSPIGATSNQFVEAKLIPKALNFSNPGIEEARQTSPLVDGIMVESAKCTRCTFCKTCPVIDAELEMGHTDPAKTTTILPDKREILYFLEKQVFSLSKAGKLSREILTEMKSIGKRLAKCFYCRRCDEACPPSIDLVQVKSLFYEILGKKNWGQTWVRFLIDPMLLWPDFKKYYISAIALLQRITRPLTKLMGRSLARQNPLQTYVNLPEFSLKKYDPIKAGAFVTKEKDNFVIHGIHLIDKAMTGYIRFRGCADTYFQSQASQAVTDYFLNVAETPFVDLTNNLCCGFPYKADGFLDKASALIHKLFRDIMQACMTISHRHGITKFSIFSNCPTCLEMLRDFVAKEQKGLKEEASHPQTAAAAKPLFSAIYGVEDRDLVDRIFLNMSISDSTSIVLEKARARQFALSDEPIGLKVPCHNTGQITEHQLEFLGHHFKKVVAFTDCCGLSGIARYKHPRIGGQIASVLMEKIKDSDVKNIVSGCPSCRDGVSIQKGAEGLDEIKSQDIFTAVLAALKKPGTISYQPKK